MKNTFFIKPLDIVIFCLCLVAVIFSFFMLDINKANRPLLFISSPQGDFVYPLSKDATYNIDGALGVSVIQIKEGKAQFLSSPCPTKTCVACLAISKNNEWIACLPNKVFIHIQGAKDKNKIDVETF